MVRSRLHRGTGVVQSARRTGFPGQDDRLARRGRWRNQGRGHHERNGLGLSGGGRWRDRNIGRLEDLETPIDRVDTTHQTRHNLLVGLQEQISRKLLEVGTVGLVRHLGGQFLDDRLVGLRVQGLDCRLDVRRRGLERQLRDGPVVFVGDLLGQSVMRLVEGGDATIDRFGLGVGDTADPNAGEADDQRQHRERDCGIDETVDRSLRFG